MGKSMWTSLFSMKCSYSSIFVEFGAQIRFQQRDKLYFIELDQLDQLIPNNIFQVIENTYNVGKNRFLCQNVVLYKLNWKRLLKWDNMCIPRAERKTAECG